MKTTDLIAQHLDYLDRICGFAKRTVTFHRRICLWWRQFLSDYGQKHILHATPDDLIQWIIHRQQEGIQNVTIQKEMCALRTLYQYLFDYGHLSNNPAASLPEVICRPADEQQYLTADECFQFLDGFDRDTPDGYRNYVISALLWCTGLRSGELCGLRWRDIDLQRGTLLVRRAKGGKQRLLFLNDRILKDMQEYHLTAPGRGQEPVFQSLTKNQHSAKCGPRPLSQSALVEMIRHHAAFVGLDKEVSPKTFRHTFATHMLEAAVPLDDIKEMLGHDDETETCIYIHVTVDAARRLLEHHMGNPNTYQ